MSTYVQQVTVNDIGEKHGKWKDPKKALAEEIKDESKQYEYEITKVMHKAAEWGRCKWVQKTSQWDPKGECIMLGYVA